MHGSLLMQSFSLFLQPQRVRRLLDAIVGELQVEAAFLQFILGQKFRKIHNFCSLVTITTARYHIRASAGDVVMMVVVMVLGMCMGGIDESMVIMSVLVLVGQSGTFQDTFLCVEIPRTILNCFVMTPYL
jgi:hypothetical protein